MAEKEFNYWDYVKAAFNLKLPLPLVGGMPVNKLLLTGAGILGFANPGFWLVGLALETAYLMWLPSDPRFQKLVAARALDTEAKSWSEQQQSVLLSLPQEAQRRYARLFEICARIAERNNPDELDTLTERKSDSLGQLLWVFLGLLVSREKLRGLFKETDFRVLSEEVDDLKRRLSKAPEGSPLAHSLSQTLTIQERRFENVSRARENLAVAEAELERIEKQVQLLSEQSAVQTDQTGLTTMLDEVGSSLSIANKWIQEHTELTSSLGTSSPHLASTALRQRSMREEQ